MEPNRKTDRILSEWDAVSASARQPAQAPRRSSARGLRAGLGLAGAGLLAAALVVAIGWVGQHSSTGVGGSGTPGPSPMPHESAAAVVASQGPSPKHSETPRPTATPTPECTAADLSAQIVSWEGAAGSRIATVEMTVTGSNACVLSVLTPERLVDGTGRVLADSGITRGGATSTVQPGEKLSTLVEASNVCGAPPAPPVTIEFEIQLNHWLRAGPVTPTDTTVPPCNGPGQPAAIQMHDWAKA